MGQDRSVIESQTPEIILEIHDTNSNKH